MLFGLHGCLSGGGEGAPPPRRIIVTAERSAQLAERFEAERQRPPTPEELDGLLYELVLEEAYYRQALALGLDQEDTVIRQRLRRKLEFMYAQADPATHPTDEQLQAYLAAHPDDFRKDPAYTFEQIYFDPELHGESIDAHMEEQLNLLRAGHSVAGDESLLPSRFTSLARTSLAAVFGPVFMGEVDELPIGEWHGPLKSERGRHLVRLQERTPAYLPPLEEIRRQVIRVWTRDEQDRAQQVMNRQVLADFDVVIESPPPPAAAD